MFCENVCTLKEKRIKKIMKAKSVISHKLGIEKREREIYS